MNLIYFCSAYLFFLGFFGCQNDYFDRPKDSGQPEADGDNWIDVDTNSETQPTDESVVSQCDWNQESLSGQPKPLGDLTGSWQLFVDDFLIASRQNLVRVYHPFVKYVQNPILRPEKEWEGNHIYVYGRVMPKANNTGYHLWYSAIDLGAIDGSSRVLYAQSEDGITWDKPNLGIRLWNGNTNNNLFIPRDRPNHIMSVMHTPGDANCPYKFINFDGSYNGSVAGYYAACSQDGIHLTDLPNNPVLTIGGDVGQFVFDPFQQQYLGYIKQGYEVSGYNRRSVWLVKTKDFTSWPSNPVLVLAPDAVDDFWITKDNLDFYHNRTHFYGASIFPYQNLFLGFLWVFRAIDPPDCTRDCDPSQGGLPGYLFGDIHVELVSSRDGVQFTRTEGDLQNGRPPLLSLGAAGLWDSHMVITANHPIIKDGQIRLYYGGCNWEHATYPKNGKFQIGMASLRRDGFASLDGQNNPGEILSKKLGGTSGPLKINFVTRSQGYIKVEVQDENGQIVPGYGLNDCTPLSGDSLEQKVSWRLQTELPASFCVLRLRFVLQNASLYSFYAGEQTKIID